MLDFISQLFSNSSFVIAIAFVGLVLVSFKPIFRFVSGALDAKISNVANDLDEAKKLREEAQDLLITYKRNQRNAAEDAANIVDKAKKNAAKMIEYADIELEKNIEQRLKLTEQKIKNMEIQATKTIYNDAVNEALLIIEDKIAEQIESSGISGELVDKSISDLRKIH